MSMPYTIKHQYNGLEPQSSSWFYSISCAQHALRNEIDNYIGLFGGRGVSCSVVWNAEFTRAEVTATITMPERLPFKIDSAVFWIENNELLNEYGEMAAAGRATLLRLQRHISEATASLTYEQVEKLTRLVSRLESAENEFVYGS